MTNCSRRRAEARLTDARTDSGPAYAWRFHRAFVAPRDFGWVAQSSNTSPPVWRSPNPTRNAFRRRSGSRDWLIAQLDASTWSFAPPLQLYCWRDPAGFKRTTGKHSTSSTACRNSSCRASAWVTFPTGSGRRRLAYCFGLSLTCDGLRAASVASLSAPPNWPTSARDRGPFLFRMHTSGRGARRCDQRLTGIITPTVLPSTVMSTGSRSPFIRSRTCWGGSVRRTKSM